MMEKKFDLNENIFFIEPVKQTKLAAVEPGQLSDD